MNPRRIGIQSGKTVGKGDKARTMENSSWHERLQTSDLLWWSVEASSLEHIRMLAYFDTKIRAVPSLASTFTVTSEP
jgi:hypothetical protein